MIGEAATATPGGAGWRLPFAKSAAWPATALFSLLFVQFWMIWTKSFNWDEFLHFSMVYQLQDGTLARPFQTLLARVLYWAPGVSDDLVTQMMAARLFIWSVFLVGLGAIYGLARQFVSREDAIWATLVYLAAGNVFVHAFAIRTDPVAMASLMLALYLLASRKIAWSTSLAVGVLVGFAGMLTVKAIFYVPCFAGLAWLRLARADERRAVLMRLAAILPVAAATFGGIFLLHRAGLAPVPPYQQPGAFLHNGLQWLTQGLLRQPGYTLMALLTAPVFVYALVKAPSSWRESGSSRERVVALTGLCLPLLVILFYRNVFPYFFVYILAPAAVALAPAMAELRKQYGRVLLTGAICAIPLVKWIAEPRDVLERQQALIDYVHQEFPSGAMYFDYSAMIADYPRVIDHLVSGLGVANYNKRGIPLIAKAVEAGELPFVIENKVTISAALAGQIAAGGLLPADVRALHENYVRVWGNLWLAGEEIPQGVEPVTIDIPAAGAYTADGTITIDGTVYGPGEAVELNAGRHVVHGRRPIRTVLWRGEHLPAAAPSTPAGPLFTDF